MKVLIINSHFSAGGPPNIVNGIYDVLIETGIECKIAAARNEVVKNKDSFVIESKLTVLSNAIFSRLFDNEGLNAKLATKRLLKFIKDYNPDIIHLHNLHGYYINIEILFDYLRRCDKRIVWTLHDCWAFTGHGALCSSIACTKWINGCFKCPLQKDYPKSFIDKSKRNYLIKKRVFSGIPNLVIVTPSKWLRQCVKQSFLKNYDVEIINNGIDQSKFFYRNSNYLAEKYNLFGKTILLAVANVWNKNKGFNDFMELSKLLKDDSVIVMVGLNEKQLASIPSNVVGLGKTKNIDELIEIYQSSNFFVNLTYCDTYPTVNIEALSCGLPVITYNTGGSPEIIDDLYSTVVEQGNVTKIADTIDILKCKEIDRNYIAKYACRFDRKATFMEYIKIFKGLRNE